jgi:hypothetical protein
MDKTLKKLVWVAVLTLIMVVVIGVILFTKSNIQSIGGVTVGNEYNATTTFPTTANVDKLIKTGGGTFGSVVITSAGNVAFDILNATTTNITQRGNLATSSILIASFPIGTAAGTYVFDTNFNFGLLYDVTAGTYGTSTILWR